ncbi:hypothetical protein GCM10023238_32610 [Streptomyces heliomycini]
MEEIVVAFTYYSNATQIMFEFNQIYRRLESSMTEAAQFTELLLDPPTVLDPPEPEPLAPQDTGVRFEAVTFAHEGAKPIFEGLDLDVPGGARIGLVGRSGGGKTTLTRLLLRMSDVDGGRILIGGQDISRLRQADLRSLIAYVPQEPAMFHRSLRDNIAFARPGATDAEIRAAAEAAHVTEFAEQLPEGFATLVGERGVKLSGGQRQRVALARAVLRDAPILLLDEATSALDSESEILVQDALWRLMDGRTALVVAHRLSTVAGMDRLVVLDRDASSSRAPTGNCSPRTAPTPSCGGTSRAASSARAPARPPATIHRQPVSPGCRDRPNRRRAGAGRRRRRPARARTRVTGPVPGRVRRWRGRLRGRASPALQDGGRRRREADSGAPPVAAGHGDGVRARYASSATERRAARRRSRSGSTYQQRPNHSMTPTASASARTPGTTTRRISRSVQPMVSARRTMPHIIRRPAGLHHLVLHTLAGQEPVDGDGGYERSRGGRAEHHGDDVDDAVERLQLPEQRGEGHAEQEPEEDLHAV